VAGIDDDHADTECREQCSYAVERGDTPVIGAASFGSGLQEFDLQAELGILVLLLKVVGSLYRCVELLRELEVGGDL
jgi:hypothetical protein